MELIKIEKENWMTKKASKQSLLQTLFLIVIIVGLSLAYQSNWPLNDENFSANYNLVFQKHQFYRLWTSLFIHADLAHLWGNLFMFAPFAYFLTGLFGFIYFPLIGFLLGGFINGLTLLTMPHQTYLIGVSGVVYWMGATYLTLSYLLDTREKKLKRFIKISGIALILFFPEVIKTEVSYMAHFLGFLVGILSGFLLYLKNKSHYEKAKKFEYKIEFDQDELF